MIFLTQMVTCQTKNISLIGGGGLSTHGTGDLSGYSFFNQADIQFSKRFFLSPGIQFTNNSQTYFLHDIRLNYVTAGIDFFTNIQYLVLNKSHHRLSIGVGPLIRFENSSYPSEVIWNLGNSGEQILTLTYDELHSTSLGYNIAPSYYYQPTKRFFIGAKINLQNDTEANIITSELVFAGIKL
jgi:hypothetical protein